MQELFQWQYQLLCHRCSQVFGSIDCIRTDTVHTVTITRSKTKLNWTELTFHRQKQHDQVWAATVVVAIVFMLAGPLLKDQWSKLFGGGKTH